jgi:transketolase
MRNTFINRLFEHAKEDSDILLMTGDLGYGVLSQFQEKLPGQFINAGIAEQNMTSAAAGLALSGKKVYTYSINNFPTLRSLEQIRDDVLYHYANVKIISVGAGLGYGSLGITHHGTEDLGILRCLPGITIFTPSDTVEAAKIADLSVNYDKPSYIRLSKGKEPNVHENVDFELEIGKAIELVSGSDVAIFVAGSIAVLAKEAAIELNQDGISTALYTFPTVKPIDEKLILEAGKKYKLIVTIEDHQITGGLGSATAEVLSSQINKAVLIRMGLNNEFSAKVGDEAYLREEFGFGKNQILSKIKGFFRSGE